MRGGVSEQELAAKATGERVTLADVEAAISGENYFTAGAAAEALGQPSKEALHLMTVCFLSLANGYTVMGKSACADPANYNAEIGQKIARQDAVNQIWPLLGYELKCRMDREQKMVAKALYSYQGYPTYIGTKIINASPMNRLEYNNLRGWQVPADENPMDDGYLVEYADLPATPNVDGFNGYVSWSPKDVFERSYRPVNVVTAQPVATSADMPGGDRLPQEAAKKEETWVDRLRVEHAELSERFNKLHAFNYSEAMSRLPSVERQDLWTQYSSMELYLGTLNRRLKRAELLA